MLGNISYYQRWKFNEAITDKYQMAQLAWENCDYVVDINDIDGDNS